MDKAITLSNDVTYNARHIVSFERFNNPATHDAFLIIHLVGGERSNIKYDDLDDRTTDYKLLMGCFT